MKPALPIFLCEPTDDGVQWRFWCPFCAAWHYHGAGPGHRGAHCLTNQMQGNGGSSEKPTNSPFKATGYVLKLDPRYQAMWKRAQAKREKREARQCKVVDFRRAT